MPYYIHTEVFLIYLPPPQYNILTDELWINYGVKTTFLLFFGFF